MKNNFFENWYKKKLEESHEPFPGDSWATISNELDINEVWNEVDSALEYAETKRRRRRGFIYLSSIAALLFVCFSLFVIVGNKPTNNPDLVINKEQSFQLSESFKFSESSATHYKKNKNSHPKYSGQNPENKIVKNESVINRNTSMNNAYHEKDNGAQQHIFQKKIIAGNKNLTGGKSGSLTGKEKMDYTEYDRMPVIVFSHIANDTSAGIALQIIPAAIGTANYYTVIANAKSQLLGFYTGAFFSGQNSWLLNRLTINGLSENSLNETVPYLGFSYGISTGYYFPSGWSLQSDWLFDSQYGQAYNRYDEGSYFKKNINVHYHQLNVYAVNRKESVLRNTNFILSNGPMFGINSKHIKSVKESTNNMNKDITEQYSKFDFGLLIGYEYALLVKKKLMFSSSISGDLGLNNIYSGNTFEPKTFNRTFNSSLRLGLGVRYFYK